MTEKRRKEELAKTTLSAEWEKNTTATPVAIPQIDFEKYMEEMEDFEMSEAEAKLLLESLFSILASIVDLTLGISPGQIACGQEKRACKASTISHADMVKLKNSSNASQATNAGITFPVEGSRL